MTIPNVGVSGVIQNPGVGSSIAQGFGGIAQMLMKQRELQLEQEKAKLNKEYIEAQMQQMADKAKADRDALAKREQMAGQYGTAVKQASTPVDASFDIPGMVQGLPVQHVQAQKEPDFRKIFADLPPEVQAAYHDEIRQQLADKSLAEKESNQAKARAKMLKGFDPKIREPLNAALQVMDAGLGAEAQNYALREIAKQPITAEMMSGYLKKFPDLAGFSPEDVQAEVFRRLGVVWGEKEKAKYDRPSSGDSAAVRTKQAALVSEVKIAEAELKRFNKRSAAATPDKYTKRLPVGGEEAVRQHVSDSTAAQGKYDARAQELRDFRVANNLAAPTATSGYTPQELAQFATEAMQQVEGDPTLTRAQKDAEKQRILGELTAAVNPKSRP